MEQIVDSAALIDSLRGRALGAEPVDVVLALRGGRAGVDSVWLVAAASVGPTADSVRATVARAVWLPKKSDFAGVRLRVTGGQSLAVRVERSILCPPRSLAPQETKVSFRVGVPEGSPLPALGSAVVRSRISADGRVLTASVVTSTGNTEVDAAIRRTARQARYMPALLDGRPVEVWMEDDRTEVVRP